MVDGDYMVIVMVEDEVGNDVIDNVMGNININVFMLVLDG